MSTRICAYPKNIGYYLYILYYHFKKNGKNSQHWLLTVGKKVIFDIGIGQQQQQPIVFRHNDL